MFLIPGSQRWASSGMLAQTLCPHLSMVALARSCKALYTSSGAVLHLSRPGGGFQRRGPYLLRQCTVHHTARSYAVAQKAEDGETTSKWQIYDDPSIYDRVFAERDFEEEVAFLFSAFERHANMPGMNSRPNVFLEMGCGPARHSIEAFGQGASRVIGVDNRVVMLRYAKQLAAEAGADIELLLGSFGSLSESLQLSDTAHLAFFPFGTLSHALTNSEAISWLRDAAACVMPGGLIVMELEHPGSIFDGTLTGGEQWEIDGAEGMDRLLITYGTEMDDFNPVSQVHTRKVAISRVGHKGSKLVGQCMVEQRVFTVPELELVAQILDLEVLQFYGSMDIKVDSLFHEDAWRMIIVMRKAQSG